MHNNKSKSRLLKWEYHCIGIWHQEFPLEMLICHNLWITDVIHPCLAIVSVIKCSNARLSPRPLNLFDIFRSRSIWIVVQHLFQNRSSWCVFVLTELQFRKNFGGKNFGMLDACNIAICGRIFFSVHSNLCH